MGVQVVTGGDMSCAILNDGSVKCWGWNTHGQLGLDTSNEKVTVPTAVDLGSLKAVMSLCLGMARMCMVLSDGSAKCAGDNKYGQLGDGTIDEWYTLKSVSNLGPGTTKSIACGGSHTCAILTTGSIQCWGSNELGQVGGGVSSSQLEWPLTVALPGRRAIRLCSLPSDTRIAARYSTTGQHIAGAAARGQNLDRGHNLILAQLMTV